MNKKFKLGIDNGELGAWAILDEKNKVANTCIFPESTNEHLKEIKYIESEIRQINKNKDIPTSEAEYDKLSKRITSLRKVRDNYAKSHELYKSNNAVIKELTGLRTLFNTRDKLKSQRRSLSVKKKYDSKILYNFIKPYVKDIEYAIIEAPIMQSATGIQASTILKSGEIYGINTCILKLFDIDYYSVGPKIWQQELPYNLPQKEKGEDNSKYLARRRTEYKRQSIQFCKDLTGYNTKDDNEAEAILIAMCTKYKDIEENE